MSGSGTPSQAQAAGEPVEAEHERASGWQGPGRSAHGARSRGDCMPKRAGRIRGAGRCRPRGQRFDAPDGRFVIIRFVSPPTLSHTVYFECRPRHAPATHRPTLIERCLAGDQQRLGADRPPALAEGLQRRLQVRRQARRGRRPDAGHLPEDLQVAAHLRPARELPDLADQREPQPLHRPLPQRPEGARDDRPRRGRRRAVPGVARDRPVRRRSSTTTGAAAAAARPGRAAADAAHRGPAARHPRSCPTRRSPSSSTCPKAP